MATERLVIAAPFVSVEEGQEFASLPPHVEIFPEFSMDNAHLPKFQSAVRTIVETSTPLAIQGGHLSLPMGSEEADTARIVTRAGRAFSIVNGIKLHNLVRTAVKANGGEYSQDHVGVNWGPSMRSSGAYELTDGEEVIFPDLAVFRYRSMGAKVVRAVYSWGHALHEQTAARS